MNAKLLEHLVKYREQSGLEVVRTLLNQKIKYQFSVVGKRKESIAFRKEIKEESDMQKIMLIEARAARVYWSVYKEKLKNKVEWKGRDPHGKDIANQLLDIGYHYLAGRLAKMCIQVNLPTELGFFHKAQSKDSHPFVYDFMEWLRPVVVDSVLIKVLSRKKKTVSFVDAKLISLFVFHIKNKFDSYLYHKKLGYCISLEYWIELLLLEFVGAVNNSKKYEPLFPSFRHESRCVRKQKPHKAV